MPFGGTGGSADTGGHVGGMGAGNGARTGTAKGAAYLAIQGNFVWAPKAISACMYFCILSGVCRANCCRAVRRIGMCDVEGQMRRT